MRAVDTKIHRSLAPTRHWDSIYRPVRDGSLKARSNGSNLLVKHYQTFLDATCLTRLNSTIKHVGRCWTVLDEVGWSLTLFKLFIQHFCSRDRAWCQNPTLLDGDGFAWTLWYPTHLAMMKHRPTPNMLDMFDMFVPLILNGSWVSFGGKDHTNVQISDRLS